MKHLCILPWIHLEATADGYTKPCCLYNSEIKIEKKKVRLNETSIEEVFFSNDMQILRQQMLTGEKPKGCAKCYDIEAADKVSKRIVANEMFKDSFHKINEPVQVPTTLDLKLGTVCNLKCRSCSSTSSLKWKEDEMALYGKYFNPFDSSYWIDDQSMVWREIERLLPTLEHLEITGGEPLLVKRHFDLLKICVTNGYAKNIIINYNTNATVMPTEEMLDIWSHFKQVKLMASIDGVEDKFEYIRHPGKWTDVHKFSNKIKQIENIYFHVCCTVTVYNIMDLVDVYKFCMDQGLADYQLYYNMVFHPSWLCVKNLPKTVKNRIRTYLNEKQRTINTTKINEVISFMMQDGIDEVHTFIEWTDKLDKIRGESWRNTFPKLSNIIE